MHMSPMKWISPKMFFFRNIEKAFNMVIYLDFRNLLWLVVCRR